MGWLWRVLSIAICLALVGLSPVAAQVPMPEGASVFPPESWRFPCARRQEVSLEVWDARARLEASGRYAVSPDGRGVCRISFDARIPDNRPLKDPRLFFPVLPTDAPLRWRATLHGEGVTTPWYAFTLEKMADHSFGARPRELETTDGTWTVSGGALENQSNPQSSFAIFRLARMNLTHPPLHATRDVNPLTHFKVDSFCNAPPCEVGLVGLLKGGDTGGNPPEQWWELKVTDNANAQVFRHRYLGGRLISTPVGRAFAWDALAGPVDVKIGVVGHHLRVQVAGRTVLCDNDWRTDWSDYYFRPDRRDPKVGVGVRWRSGDDDEGTNSVRIDQIRVQAMPNGDLRCRRPLPD